MKMIVATCGEAADSPRAFVLQDQPVPEPQGRDILVGINAMGMNPVDTKVRTGMEGERVLGWDACGIVEAVGSEVAGFAIGDRVFYAGDLTRPGTNTEYHLVDERIVAKAPASLSDAQVAAMPLTSITAWEALFERLQFVPEPGANRGQSIMIIGGAGGVGSIATQLAHWAGLTVYATASRPETAAWCKKLGADGIVNHRKNLAEELAAAGAGQVDAIFCTTHLERHWQAMADSIRPQGKVVFIDDPEHPLDLTVFKMKSVTLVWEFMYTRSMFQTPDMAEQGKLLTRVSGLLEDGTLVSTLSETLTGLTVENIRAMHIRQESGAMVGKQVLVV
ncbi:zinc-binding alcohol dehydrogenase family protein [Desulfoplanes formicivorans]|uniref:Zinc-type alcohol dehydrogenase-like protein n=1 Tax=Desulfoplanes formicivorans TaxID=1592317 RepID=A0A194AEB0_9BACT|nr:zinc-binding alcohol dehydrogenase family protein [Desulfoplanes formicivorans]GAU07456.1 oxidoreductase [Desulfoplanes formicivorans]